MSGAPTPQQLLAAIAAAATGGHITDPMPATNPGTANAASLDVGFPPITMQPEPGGGLPPFGQDMNGLFFLVSGHTLYVEAGQLYQFSSTLAGALGGYKLGAILGMVDGSGAWLNILDGNSNNPDTGGAGWVSLTSYGAAQVNGLTGGTVTLTVGQYKHNFIVLSGALVSNLTVVFPALQQEWLVINLTTGAFNTVAKTAAQSGNVPILQGGRGSPTGVYCGEDGNLYPTVAPLSVAIDQAPTPNTIAERTNTGALLATVFNSNEAASNPTIDNVIVDDGTGNFLKISLANFLAQAAPHVSGGAGTITIAGITFKWGNVSKTASDRNFPVAYPVAMPTATDAVFLTSTDVAAGSNTPGFEQIVRRGTLTAAGFTIASTDFGAGAPDGNIIVYWFAIGH